MADALADARAGRFGIVGEKSEIDAAARQRLAVASRHQRQDSIGRFDLTGIDQPLEAQIDEIGLLARAIGRARSGRHRVRQQQAIGQLLQDRRARRAQPRHQRDDQRTRRALPERLGIATLLRPERPGPIRVDRRQRIDDDRSVVARWLSARRGGAGRLDRADHRRRLLLRRQGQALRHAEAQRRPQSRWRDRRVARRHGGSGGKQQQQTGGDGARSGQPMGWTVISEISHRE